MATRIKGVVTWAGNEKKFDNYSFKLEGREEWFRNRNRCEETIQPGYTVGLVVEKSDRGDMDVVRKPKLIKKGSPPAKTGGKGGYKGGFKDDPKRAAAIQWQHSQDMGIRAAEILLANEAFKLGAKTKPQERRKQIEALIDEMTVKYYRDIDTQEPMKVQEEVEDDLEEEEGEDAFDDEDDQLDDADDEVDWDED